MYLPVFEPRNSLGFQPASTIHSYTLSKSIRWRGSRELTWIGGIPKNRLSNLSARGIVPDRFGKPCNPVNHYYNRKKFCWAKFILTRFESPCIFCNKVSTVIKRFAKLLYIFTFWKSTCHSAYNNFIRFLVHPYETTWYHQWKEQRNINAQTRNAKQQMAERKIACLEKLCTRLQLAQISVIYYQRYGIFWQGIYFLQYAIDFSLKYNEGKYE